MTQLPRITAALALGILAAGSAQAGKTHIQPGTRAPVVLRMQMPVSARADALVNADGSVVVSKGVAAVSNLAAGYYCVTLARGVSAATAVPVMTFNYNSTEDFDVFIANAPAFATDSCPANSIGVVTYNADAGGHTLTNEGFSIVVP